MPSTIRSLNPVLYGPGLTLHTSMPCGASSPRRLMVNASTACFVMQYGDVSGEASLPATDDTLMMRPDPRSNIFGTTAWVSSTMPKTLTSKLARTLSIGTVDIGAITPIPALLISTSTSRSAACAMSALDVTSSLIVVNSGCSAASASACSWVSVVAMTEWPRAASSIAAPLPKPEPAPVMRIVRCVIPAVSHVALAQAFGSTFARRSWLASRPKSSRKRGESVGYTDGTVTYLVVSPTSVEPAGQTTCKVQSRESSVASIESMSARDPLRQS